MKHTDVGDEAQWVEAEKDKQKRKDQQQCNERRDIFVVTYDSRLAHILVS